MRTHSLILATTDANGARFTKTLAFKPLASGSVEITDAVRYINPTTGLEVVRGAETLRVSAAIDRLRALAAAYDVRVNVGGDDLRALVDAYDAAEAECARLQHEPAAYKKERDAALARENAAAADRDYWREQMTAAAPCVDEIRRLTRRVVRGGTGCALDPVLAVDTALASLDGLMVAVDRITSERDALAAAVRAYLADADGPYHPRPHMRDALVAALAERV